MSCKMFLLFLLSLLMYELGFFNIGVPYYKQIIHSFPQAEQILNEIALRSLLSYLSEKR